jgi:hypothetical protein
MPAWALPSRFVGMGKRRKLAMQLQKRLPEVSVTGACKGNVGVDGFWATCFAIVAVLVIVGISLRLVWSLELVQTQVRHRATGRSAADVFLASLIGLVVILAFDVVMMIVVARALIRPRVVAMTEKGTVVLFQRSLTGNLHEVTRFDVRSLDQPTDKTSARRRISTGVEAVWIKEVELMKLRADLRRPAPVS